MGTERANSAQFIRQVRITISLSNYYMHTTVTPGVPHTSWGEIFKKSRKLHSNKRTCALPQRSIFAFCANVLIREKQNAKHRPPLIIPVLLYTA